MADQEQAVEQVLLRYHQAIADNDMESAHGCLGEGHFSMEVGHGHTSDPSLWRASGFRTREDLLRLYLSYDAPVESSYENHLDFIHTHINSNAAVVIVRETGSSTVGDHTYSWTGVTNLWCLAKIGEHWRIVGSMHHLGEDKEA